MKNLKPISRPDLVYALTEVGFTERGKQGAHSIYSHPTGTVLTLPPAVGKNDIPQFVAAATEKIVTNAGIATQGRFKQLVLQRKEMAKKARKL